MHLAGEVNCAVKVTNENEPTSSPLGVTGPRVCRVDFVQVKGGDLSVDDPPSRPALRPIPTPVVHVSGCILKRHWNCAI